MILAADVDKMDLPELLELVIETEKDPLRKTIIDAVSQLISDLLDDVELAANVFNQYGIEHDKKADELLAIGEPSAETRDDSLVDWDEHNKRVAKARRNHSLVKKFTKRYGIDLDKDFNLKHIEGVDGNGN